MRKTVVFVLVAVLVAVAPMTLMAQTDGDTCALAKTDAEADVNKFVWIGAGFLLGPVGILLGYLVAPSPPASRLMGKSSNYVMQYTECYKDSASSAQGMDAIIGCGIAGACAAAYYVYVLAVVGSAYASYY
ncbi:MAG: hypothetical protein ACLFP1_09715 [Candidatus Goldiibacteriota bacterium]